MCYKSGVTNAANCDYTHKSAFSICLEESVTWKDDCANTWLTCEDLDVALCTGTVDSSTLHKFASNFLGCRRGKEPRFCSTKSQCEDETGQCHGPRLEENVCMYNPQDYSQVRPITQLNIYQPTNYLSNPEPINPINHRRARTTRTSASWAWT
jgi:hypothetical protein